MDAAMMNIDALGNVGELVRAGAVVLSLLYLARQVRHNANIAKAESQRALLSTSFFFQPMATDPDLAEIFRGGLNRYESLDSGAQARFNCLMHPFVNHIESAYQMHEWGLLDFEAYERWMAGLAAVTNMPGCAQWWGRVKVMFLPAFVDAIEKKRDEIGGAYRLIDAWHFYEEAALKA